MVLPAPLKPGSKITLLDLSKDSFSFKRILDWWPQNTDVNIVMLLSSIIRLYSDCLSCRGSEPVAVLPRSLPTASSPPSSRSSTLSVAFPVLLCIDELFLFSIKVHEVGSYFISLAENLNDLDRIDKNVFEAPILFVASLSIQFMISHL